MKKFQRAHLHGHSAHHVGQFLHHQIHALYARLQQEADLALDDGVEGHVRREEAHADAVDVADGERDVLHTLSKFTSQFN